MRQCLIILGRLSPTTFGVAAVTWAVFGGLGCRSALEPPGGRVQIVSGHSGMFPQQQFSLLVSVDSILVDPARVMWESSNPSILAVDSAGGLVASALGSATIRAHYGTSSDSLTISVVAPPEGIIVFIGPGVSPERGTRLYAIDANGQNLRLLSGAFADVGPPAFSPNAALLAIPMGYPPNVAVYNAATGGFRGIPSSGLGCGSSLPSWSPDTTLIAFSSCAGGGFDIWIARIDGTEQRRLTSFSSPVAQRSFFYPNGTELIVQHIVEANGVFSVDLVKVSLADTSTTRMTDTPAIEHEPVIDWNTARVIFVATVASHDSNGAPTALFESDSALQTTRQLTPTAVQINGTYSQARFPTLSPDAEWIAFTWTSPRDPQPGLRLGDFRIGATLSLYVMRRSDGLIVQLTDFSLATQPAWTLSTAGLE